MTENWQIIISFAGIYIGFILTGQAIAYLGSRYLDQHHPDSKWTLYWKVGWKVLLNSLMVVGILSFIVMVIFA